MQNNGYNTHVTFENRSKGDIMQTNYHTHTYRCMHAIGHEEDYVLYAIAQGYNTIGFSDHGPWPYENGYRSPIRMTMDQLVDYEKSVRMLASRYQDRITIHLGYEYEYFPEFIPFLQETRNYVDYLLLGNHYAYNEQSPYFGNASTPKEILRYANSTIEGMQSGLFDCLAHPDLFLLSYPQWDETAIKVTERICIAASKLDLPLEYNISGFAKKHPDSTLLGFPYPKFWEIACNYGCRVIIGCDAHTLQALDSDLYHQAKKTLTEMGANLIYHLW